MKKIPQIEPHMDNLEKQELISVVESGWFTEAKKTRKFERSFVNLLAVNMHAQ